jgi:O-methyltransferase involved in polyketide biosynthesis
MLETEDFDIQSTMVSTLWARAVYSKLYPEILNDKKSLEIIKRVYDDFPNAKNKFENLPDVVDEFLGLSIIIRARVFDDFIKQHIQKFPRTSVVNLGCGLDTTFYRIDNGNIDWYDLDLPEAIKYRNKVITPAKRCFSIPNSIFDYSWMNKINYEEEKGILFISGGLFYYYEERNVLELIERMATHFKGGELIFDNLSGLGNKILTRKLRKTGVKYKFGVGNPKKQLNKLSDKITVIDWFPFFSKIKNNPKWKFKTRLMMKLTNWLNLGKFILISFQNNPNLD